jgi:Flp pilus assembly protein TadD
VQGAVDKFVKIVRHDPQSAIAHGEIGLTLFASGQPDKAATYFKKAFDLVTEEQEKSDALNWSMIRANYAFLLVRTGGSMKSVAKNFKRAALLNPNFAEAYLYWGNALQELREPDAAREAYVPPIPHSVFVTFRAGTGSAWKSTPITRKCTSSTPASSAKTSTCRRSTTARPSPRTRSTRRRTLTWAH